MKTEGLTKTTKFVTEIHDDVHLINVDHQTDQHNHENKRATVGEKDQKELPNLTKMMMRMHAHSNNHAKEINHAK